MIGQLVGFVGASLAIIVVPGPDLVLLLRNAAAAGRRAATATAAGIMVGNAVLASAAVVGLTALFRSSAVLYDVVRLAGAAYLVVLGVQSLVALVRRRGQIAPAVAGERPDAGRAFRQGLVSNLLNPKVAVFYLALFPQFTLPGVPALVQNALFAALFCLLALCWYVLVLTLLARIERLLQRGRIRSGISAVSGTVLVGLGASLALTRA